MKQSRQQVTSLFCCIALLCSVLAGCSNGENDPIGESSSTSSQSSQSIDTGSAPDPDIPLNQMSYEEYFSKERECVDETLAIDNGFYYDINEDGSVTRFVFVLDDTARKWIRTDEKVISSKLGFVNDYTEVYGNPIFIVNQHQIIQTDVNGENLLMIHEDTDSISRIFATRELIFFLRGNHTICRLHRKSGIVDELVTSDEEIAFYRVISNYALCWFVYTPEWKDFSATGAMWEDAPPEIRQCDAYFYNSKTGDKRKVSDSDYDSDGFFQYEIKE